MLPALEYLIKNLEYECTQGEYQPLVQEDFYYGIGDEETIIAVLKLNPRIFYVRFAGRITAVNLFRQFREYLTTEDSNRFIQHPGCFVFFYCV